MWEESGFILVCRGKWICFLLFVDGVSQVATVCRLVSRFDLRAFVPWIPNQVWDDALA